MTPIRKHVFSLTILTALCVFTCTYFNKAHARTKKKPITQMKTYTEEKNTPKKNPPKDLYTLKQLDEELHAGKPTLLMIHTIGCPLCEATRQPFINAAEDNPHIAFRKAERRQMKGVSTKYNNPMTSPTLILHDTEGKEIHRFSGMKSRDQINDEIAKYFPRD